MTIIKIRENRTLIEEYDPGKFDDLLYNFFIQIIMNQNGSIYIYTRARARTRATHTHTRARARARARALVIRNEIINLNRI